MYKVVEYCLGGLMNSSEEKRLIRMGLKVSYYRKLANISAAYLAEQAGVSISTIWKLEGPTNPKAISIRTLWRISDVLDVHISKLLEDDD